MVFRITDYADRLLEGLGTVDYSDAMKEMQTNWIGKSFGAEIDFAIYKALPEKKLRSILPAPIRSSASTSWSSPRSMSSSTA